MTDPELQALARETAEQCYYARETDGTVEGAYALVSYIEAALRAAMRLQAETDAQISENPYSNDVQALGPDEPLEVGRKIAIAIRMVL